MTNDLSSKITVCIPYYGKNRDPDLIRILVNNAKSYELFFYILHADIDSNLFAKALNIRNVYAVNTGSILSVSKARNRLIELCTTKYLTFLDADDSINYKLLLLTLQQADSFDADVIISPYQEEHRCYYGKVNKCTFLTDYLSKPYGKSILHVCWSKIYRVSVLKSKKITFPESWSIYEDTYFVSQIIKYTDNIYFGSHIFYSYNLNNTGLSSKLHLNPCRFHHSLRMYAGILSDDNTQCTEKLLETATSYFFHKINFMLLSRSLLYQLYVNFLLISNRYIWRSLLVFPNSNHSKVHVLNNHMISLVFTPLSIACNRFFDNKYTRQERTPNI